MKKAELKKMIADKNWAESKDKDLKARILARNSAMKVERERKSEMISLRITPTLLESLKDEAAKKNKGYQTLVVDILSEFINQITKPEKAIIKAITNSDLDLELRVRALESQFAQYTKTRSTRKRA